MAASIAQKSGATLEMLHVNLAAIYSAPLSEYVAASSVVMENKQYGADASEELEQLRTEVFAGAEYSGLDVTTRVEEAFCILQ